jgi:hypothetical protein
VRDEDDRQLSTDTTYHQQHLHNEHPSSPSLLVALLSSAVLYIYAWIGLLQKNPAKRLNWPHLLEHPFVRETELDRDQQRIEKSHFLQCGGFGGPRERLEVIMVRRAAVDDHLR